MQVLIMAAGMGTRLGVLTTQLPKALIEVAGQTLIDRALGFAAQAGAARRVVVGGFCYEALATHVREIAPDAVLVDNRRYRDGNLLTLHAGVPSLARGGFLLMNTDHIYPRPVAEIVAATAAGALEVTAFCDFDRPLGADDMKVQLDAQRRVLTMSKQLERWDAGYVGMTFVPGQRRADYLEASDRVLREDGDAAHVERILVKLAELGAPPAIADISGHGWHEVDEPAERDRAEQALRRGR